MDASADVMCKFYTENVRVYETSIYIYIYFFFFFFFFFGVTATTEDGMLQLQY